ncbi:RagB/SusD family nutrient uptake outer membrane protein [Spongiimicrobium salis]|uniref:RagB/SusD family nutrient uptake outer membrane protein n=1 Tax=Spongiimicrobium salis TaxID=1667022 RepID=UPI00374DA99C
MKTSKLFLIFFGLALFSCSDLEEEPVGILAPEGFFNSVASIQTAVNGSMTHAINEEWWGRKLSIALMLRSDMVNLQSSQTRRVEMDQLTTTDDNEMVFDPWERGFSGIAAANLAIDGATLVDAPDEEKNPVVAQAYFMRAYYYFHFVRLHGDIPYFDETNFQDVDGALEMSSTPAAQVYENILADLEFAKTWLPDTQTSRAVPSKAAASAYIALVNLTLGNWQDAFNEATEIINNAGNYGLALDSDFQNLFNAEVIDNSPEPIFSLDYNNFEAPDNAYDQIAPMTGIRGDDRNQGGGWSVAVPTLAVYESFEPGDYRRTVSFDEEASIGGALVPFTNFTISGHEHAGNMPYIAKYTRFPGPFDRGNARATSHNVSMIRYAEVLLIAAEAAVELGDNASALNYINQIRARARAGGSTKTGADVSVTIPPSAVPADLTGTVTIADVMEERRIELAFEGKRWYDIARRRMGNEVYSATGLEGEKANFSDVDYLIPIPFDEIQRNPNLSQNPF